MKLFTTIKSERGKPVTKSGNEFIEIRADNEKRERVLSVYMNDRKKIIDITYQGRLYKFEALDTEDIPL